MRTPIVDAVAVTSTAPANVDGATNDGGDEGGRATTSLSDLNKKLSYKKPAPTTPGNIQHMQWWNGTMLDPYAAQIALPPQVIEMFTEYCIESGIFNIFNDLLVETDDETSSSNRLQPLEHDASQVLNLVDTEAGLEYGKWYLQRPGEEWKSDTYWLSVNDATSHHQFLTLLGLSGFDVVLEGIGKFFDLEGIDVYSAGFIAESYCEEPFFHHDFSETNGDVFNVIIPLVYNSNTDIIKDDTLAAAKPEFLIGQRDNGIIADVHFEPNVGYVVGDRTIYATEAFDYKTTTSTATTSPDDSNKVRIAMTIYLGDINRDNVDAIIEYMTDPYPPSNEDYLLGNRGRHWSKHNPKAKLPKDYFEDDEVEIKAKPHQDFANLWKEYATDHSNLDIVIEQLAMMITTMESNGQITEEIAISKLQDTIRKYDDVGV